MPQTFTGSPRCSTMSSENIFGIFTSANAAGDSAATASKTANFFIAIQTAGGGAPATLRNAMPIPRSRKNIAPETAGCQTNNIFENSPEFPDNGGK